MTGSAGGPGWEPVNDDTRLRDSGEPVAASDPAAWGLSSSAPAPGGEPPPDPGAAWLAATEPAPPARKGPPAWSGWALRLGVIGLFVVGGLILRDRLTGSPGDLKVGDCFDEPTQQTEVSEVQHHPCTDPHDAEVFFVGNHPDADAYPTVDTFDEYVVANCVPAFETYIGRDYESDTEYDFGYFYPTGGGWGDGDRELSCYAYRLDGAKLTRSVKSGS